MILNAITSGFTLYFNNFLAFSKIFLFPILIFSQKINPTIVKVDNESYLDNNQFVSKATLPSLDIDRKSATRKKLVKEYNKTTINFINCGFIF